MSLNIREQKARLETIKDDLENTLRTRSGIEIVQAADPIDEIAEKAERELLVARLDGIAVQYRAVIAALKRIADGAYGECMECEDPISERRLAAVPWAALCIKCQEALESNAGPADHDSGAHHDASFAPRGDSKRARLDVAA